VRQDCRGPGVSKESHPRKAKRMTTNSHGDERHQTDGCRRRTQTETAQLVEVACSGGTQDDNQRGDTNDKDCAKNLEVLVRSRHAAQIGSPMVHGGKTDDDSKAQQPSAKHSHKDEHGTPAAGIAKAALRQGRRLIAARAARLPACGAVIQLVDAAIDHPVARAASHANDEKARYRRVAKGAGE
jgi:hypothetical protein